MMISRTPLMIALVISLFTAGAALAWDFDAAVCGASDYTYRNRDAELVLSVVWTLGNDPEYSATFPLTYGTYNPLTPVWSSGSYEVFAFTDLPWPARVEVKVVNLTTGEVLASAYPSCFSISNRPYVLTLARANCQQGAVAPIENEVHWNEVHWNEVHWNSDDSRTDIDDGPIKSLPADEPATWGRLKASYR
jgi:hypothetical protein